MKLSWLPYQPRYTADELAIGIAAGVALHLLLAGPFIVKAILPHGPEEEEKPLVSRPVVQALLLKLGKPLDPSKLPDRLVPQKRTAPKQQLTASREDPAEKKADAGAPPPPNTEDSDIQNLISKSDVFAEDTKSRPEEGHELGVEGGTETDPNKVRAGDMYAAQLGKFFGDRLSVPTVISVAEARKLCVLLQININRQMSIWHVRTAPIIGSGNELFDDAARTLLMKLLDDKTPLPSPPPELDEQYRGRTVNVVIPGDPHGDTSRCMPK